MRPAIGFDAVADVGSPEAGGQKARLDRFAGYQGKNPRGSAPGDAPATPGRRLSGAVSGLQAMAGKAGWKSWPDSWCVSVRLET